MSKKVDISIFLPSLRGGGAEKSMLNLAKGFEKKGLKVELVLAKAEGEYLSNVPKEIEITDLNSKRVLYGLPKLANYLKKKRPKILISAMTHSNIIAILAKWVSRTSTQVTVTEHAALSKAIENRSLFIKSFIAFLIRFTYPHAHSIVAVSRGVANDIAQVAGLPLEEIKVIYNPVVTPELLSKAEEPIKHPWFCSTEYPIIISVGRLTEAKDHPTLLRAFRLVRKKKLSKLVILGEGEDRIKLENLAKELKIEKDVALPGFVENPYKYMRKANVFVLSSKYEGFGNVLAEALVMGIPIVSTDCPSGPSEILQDGKFGTLVPVGDYKRLAKEILKVLNANKKQKNFKINRAIKEFTLESSVEKYLSLFRKNL